MLSLNCEKEVNYLSEEVANLEKIQNVLSKTKKELKLELINSEENLSDIFDEERKQIEETLHEKLENLIKDMVKKSNLIQNRIFKNQEKIINLKEFNQLKKDKNQEFSLYSTKAWETKNVNLLSLYSLYKLGIERCNKSIFSLNKIALGESIEDEKQGKKILESTDELQKFRFNIESLKLQKFNLDIAMKTIKILEKLKTELEREMLTLMRVIKLFRKVFHENQLNENQLNEKELNEKELRLIYLKGEVFQNKLETYRIKEVVIKNLLKKKELKNITTTINNIRIKEIQKLPSIMIKLKDNNN